MSAYVRKTQDVWEIKGNFGGADGWEILAEYDRLEEARADVKEYRASGHGRYQLRSKRVSLEREGEK